MSELPTSTNISPPLSALSTAASADVSSAGPSSETCLLYRYDQPASGDSTEGRAGEVIRLIASTPQSRLIVNDPFCLGVDYTSRLKQAVAAALRVMKEQRLFSGIEAETSVLHILRGGLNFGLREALADAFCWNVHGSAFISAQRARRAENPEDWVITESDYRKISLHPKNTIVLGDVVATGTSLEYALRLLGQTAAQQKSEISSIVFFTIGSPRTEEILRILDPEFRSLFPSFRGSTVVYLEGIFEVASAETPLRIKIDGTDLIRRGGIFSPEFLESQYLDPAYPLERCTIYDAGSRAFDIPEYLSDVELYWKQVSRLAEEGVSFGDLVRERCPDINPAKFGTVDLSSLAQRQIGRVQKIIGG